MLKVQKLYDACKAAFSSHAGSVPSRQPLQRVRDILESIEAADVGLDEVAACCENRNAANYGANQAATAAAVGRSSQGDGAEARVGSNERNGSGATVSADGRNQTDGNARGGGKATRGGAAATPKCSPPITYLHLYECDDFSIGIFCIPASATIPLHNHPGMTVLSKLLFGCMHVRSFDWAFPTEPSTDPYQPRLAELVEDQVVAAPCPPDILFPTSGGNIHSFTALSPCAVLDVLAPPYNADAGRHCTYFRELVPESFPALESTEGLKEGVEYGWLEEFQPPDSFVVRRGNYRGPMVQADMEARPSLVTQWPTGGNRRERSDDDTTEESARLSSVGGGSPAVITSSVAVASADSATTSVIISGTSSTGAATATATTATSAATAGGDLTAVIGADGSSDAASPPEILRPGSGEPTVGVLGGESSGDAGSAGVAQSGGGLLRSEEGRRGRRRVQRQSWSGACMFWSIAALIVVIAALGAYLTADGQLPNDTVRYVLVATIVVFAVASLALLLAIRYVDPGIVPPSAVPDPVVVRAEMGDVAHELLRDSTGQWVRAKLIARQALPRNRHASAHSAERGTPPSGATDEEMGLPVEGKGGAEREGEPAEGGAEEKGGGGAEVVEEVETQRYCITCHVWKAPRTSHCSECGCCMERLDHHCDALGTCIARRNHRFFIAFLLASSLAATAVIVSVCLQLASVDWSRGLEGQPWQMYALLMLLPLSFYGACLVVFALLHCAILLCDVTTKEYIQYQQGKATASVTHQRTWEGLKENLHDVARSQLFPWEQRILVVEGVDGKVLQRYAVTALTNETAASWGIMANPTAQWAMVTLPAAPCFGCTIRLTHQPVFTQFPFSSWSHISLSPTPLFLPLSLLSPPHRQCFCAEGWMGPQCAQRSPLSLDAAVDTSSWWREYPFNLTIHIATTAANTITNASAGGLFTPTISAASAASAGVGSDGAIAGGGVRYLTVWWKILKDDTPDASVPGGSALASFGPQVCALSISSLCALSQCA
ncbi:unnamed protein product [Closterium sp. Yama58-4]|nr:unnamed protein product [Closterium sp. Yama58-4]